MTMQPIRLIILSLLCISLSAKTKIKKTFNSTHVKKGHFVYLKLKHIQQRSSMCAPTAAAMVIDYYGRKLPTNFIASLASERSRGQEGTNALDLINGVKKIGYRWTQKKLTYSRKGFTKQLQVLLDELNQKRPVLISYESDSASHMVAVVGYDRQRIYIQDPNSNKSNPYKGAEVYSHRQFEKLWQHSRRVRRYVLTSPSLHDQKKSLTTKNYKKKSLITIKKIVKSLKKKSLIKALRTNEFEFTKENLLNRDQQQKKNSVNNFFKKDFPEIVTTLKKQNRLLVLSNQFHTSFILSLSKGKTKVTLYRYNKKSKKIKILELPRAKFFKNFIHKKNKMHQLTAYLVDLP